MNRTTVILAAVVALVILSAAACTWYLLREKPEIELVYRLDYASLDRQVEAARYGLPPDRAGKSALEREVAKLESRRKNAPELALRAARQRIEEAGVKGAEVELFDDARRLRILLPRMTPSLDQTFKRYMRTQGRLTFHLVASEDRDPEIVQRVLDPGNLQHSYGGYELYYMEHKGNSGAISREAVVLQVLPVVDGSQVDFSQAARNRQGGWEIHLRLDVSASARFEEVTAANVGRRLAMLLDGFCCSAPLIKERIGGEVCISGSFSEQEARELAAILRCPVLPVDLVLESEYSLKGRDEGERKIKEK